MPRKGRRSQAQKLRWTKVDLTGQTSISKGVAQVYDRQQSEDCDTSRILSVQASHCQSDASEGTLFKQPDLDRVLEEGDALYVGIKMQLIAERRFRQDHLSMDEVPVSITTSNHMCVQKSDMLRGYPRARGTPEMEGWWILLDERLQCLSTDVSHAQLMECFAVFRDRSGRYGFFDSHSRTAEGFPHPTGDGTAVMVTFTHLNDMIIKLLPLFQNHGAQTCYEFMPVAFEMEQQSEKQLQGTSSLPKPPTVVGITMSDNLVLAEDKNQDAIKVIKTNKQ
ncbi:hypothetical protein QQF64_023901 [Cirrhinus molitorella]|uniref:Uncharacterized protein n=1 Tax=Cirrhinus molitorella TaxID=172907 RepID=A0ABR3NJP9_9TELE